VLDGKSCRAGVVGGSRGRDLVSGPADIKRSYSSASFVKDRVVFNIKGNHDRLIVHVNDAFRIALIRFVGTHAEYDTIDVAEV